MDGRPWDRCESVPGQNSAYRPLSRDLRSSSADRRYDPPRTLILVLAPHGAGCACVAHRPCLVHGAEGQRILRPAEQAVDLHRGGISRDDADVANGAATDTT